MRDLAERWGVVVGYRFQHLSNGNTAPRNPGINSNAGYLGLALQTLNALRSNTHRSKDYLAENTTMNITLWGATILHITRDELSSAITTAILLVMVTFVAYMRWKVKLILPRTVA